jgi:hypothetical protein
MAEGWKLRRSWQQGLTRKLEIMTETLPPMWEDARDLLNWLFFCKPHTMPPEESAQAQKDKIVSQPSRQVGRRCKIARNK